MSSRGPLLTLSSGVVLAGVLLTLSTQAHTRSTAVQDAAARSTPSPAPAASTVAPPSPTPSISKPPAATGSTTFAGRAASGGATIGMTVENGRAIAYVCDGVRTEAWLHGPADGGKLALTGAGGSRLTGTYSAKKASVTVTTAGHRWRFDAAVAHKPSGLWRGTANVRGAKIEGGWVVLADGTQVGVATVDGRPQPAPSFDPAAGTATVDGGSVPVVPAEPTP